MIAERDPLQLIGATRPAGARTTLAEAQSDVFDYIERFHNP